MKALLRMRGLIRKEVLQIRRDPSSMLLALAMPVALLFLFGYGVSLDAKNIPIAIVMDNPGSHARELAGRFMMSRYFEPMICASAEEGTNLVREGKADGMVYFQGDFESRFLRGEGVVQLILNGVDANRASLIQGYAAGILGTWQAILAARGETVSAPVIRVEPRIWFNGAAESSWFLVPGLLTLVMTLIGVLLTALVIAREWERGTMEALLATPLRPTEFLLGKLLPYYGLGMIGMALSVGLAVSVFHVPFRGSLLALAATSSVFLLASLGLGLFISATVRIQFVAAQISIIVGFLPAFFLSGLLFDLGSTPRAIQVLSHVIPARYFVSISHTLFLAGDVWAVLLPNAAILGGIALFLLILTRRRIGLRLGE